MRRLIALILCVAFPVTVFAAEPSNSYKVTYDGGSLLGQSRETRQSWLSSLRRFEYL